MEPSQPNSAHTSTSTTEENLTKATLSEPWHAPLNRVTTFSKYFALALFIILPFVGFWLGYLYGLQTAPVPGSCPLCSYEAFIEHNHSEEVSDVEKNEEGWETYVNEQLGFAFEHPPILTLTELDGVVELHHAISYENYGDCDMIGDYEVTYDTLTDFRMSFDLVSPPVSPPYVDGQFSEGELEGVYAYMGAEGCGETHYYFQIDDDTTLLVKRDAVQALSGISNLWNEEEILEIKVVISSEENEEFFRRIISTIEIQAD
jgi:hypothetical protein